MSLIGTDPKFKSGGSEHQIWHANNFKRPVIDVWTPVVRGSVNVGLWEPDTNNAGVFIWYPVDTTTNKGRYELRARLHGNLSLVDASDSHIVTGFIADGVPLPALPLNANWDMPCGHYLDWAGGDGGQVYIATPNMGIQGLLLSGMSDEWIYTENVGGTGYTMVYASWVVF